MKRELLGRLTRHLAPPTRLAPAAHSVRFTPLAPLARFAHTKRLATLLLAAVAAGGAWAGFDMINPVTGDTETYTYKFVGTTHIWNGTQYWQDSNGANPSAVPGVTGSKLWDPILFDASVNSIDIKAGLSVEGWNLRMGLYNGANVTLNNLQKLQGETPMWITVDGTSQCTIGNMVTAKLVNSSPLSLYSAKTGGIAWSKALSDSSNGDGSSMPFHYYLTGTGSVAFNAGISVTGTGAHVIKRADVTLDGGTKARKSKTLVSFTSSSISFSADATIYVKDPGGTTKRTITATQITSSTPTITTDYPVGTCELVQESDGIKLYYIDGDYDTDFVAYIGDDPTANKYHTIVEAAAAIAADNTLVKLTLLSSTEESFVVPSVGFVFDTNGKTVTGTISGTSGVGLSESDGVYTGIANTAATWTGTAGDGLWENAQNWSTKSVPASTTTVTFEDDATVAMGASETIYGLVVNQGKTLTLYRTGNSAGNQNNLWGTLMIGAGCVTGQGTVKLICAGISKTVGNFTINANIEFLNNGSYDSFLEETASGTFTINGTVTGSGYLQVKTSTTFNGNVTIPEGSTIKVNSWTYNLGDSASLTGAGTLVFDGATVQDSFKTALQDSTKWTGICELRSGTIEGLDLSEYGNENAYVCVNGLGGYFKRTAAVNRVADGIKGLKVTGDGLSLGNWSTDHTYIIAADISGSGPININTQSNAGNPLSDATKIDKFAFTGDMSAFTGKVQFKNDSYRPCYIFCSESDINSLPTPTDYGQIFVMAGKTVYARSQWSAPGGLYVSGQVDTTDVAISGTIYGDGVLSFSVPDPSNFPTLASTWTGTAILSSRQGSMTVNLGKFGVSGSKIKVMGFQGSGTGNSVKLGTDAVTATVELAGTVRLQHGADNTTYSIAALTGSGDFNATLTGTPTSTSNMRCTYSFTKLVDYTGTLSTVTAQNTESKQWWTKLTIGTVYVSSLDLTSNNPIVKLGGTHNITAIPALTVGGVDEGHSLYQASDGNLYVKVASVTVNDVTTYYPTIQAAADAAMAAGGETISFTRIDSDAVTSLPGWTYDDNADTFTRSGYACNTTTGTEYATLADAISASSEGDTIQLLYGNSETAVDTTGKDFIFDENGYAFSGTFTGSGRIVLSTKPSTTTWGSARFVATAANEGDPVWTGTVATDWDVTTSAEFPFNDFGITGSTVEILGSVLGWSLPSADVQRTVAPAIKVTGTLEIDNGTSTAANATIFTAVTGAGTLKFTTRNMCYTITDLNDWNGTIEISQSQAKITNINSGSGKIVYNESSTLPTSGITVNAAWQGTVTLNKENIVSSADFAAVANRFGVSGSTVEIGENGTLSGYLNADITPNLKVTGNATFTNGSRDTKRTLTSLSGGGNVTFGYYYYNSGETTNYGITTLKDWTGTLTISSAKITIGTVADTATGDVVIDYTNSAWTEKLSQYCGTNSRLIVRNLTGYLSDGNNSSNTGKIDAQALEIGNVTIKDAWYLSSPSWTDGKTVKFAKMHLTGTLKMGKDGGTSWTYDNQRGCYMVDSLSVSEDGEIEVANQFAFRINAVEADGATPGQLVVPVTLSNAGDAKAVGELFGPDGNKLTAVNPIPVTVNGTANGQKLVYATIDANSGLYVAVASVVDGSTTSYYATLDDAKSNIGAGYIVPLKSGLAIELDDGETVRVNNSGTYQITVTAASGLMLGSSVGEDYTTYSAASATIMDGEDDVGTLVENPYTGEITALVTKPAATVTIPAAASSVAVASAGNVISLTLAAGSPIAAASVAVYSTDASGAYSVQTSLDVTVAFAITVVPATATTAGSVTISLDATKSVSVWTGENDSNSNRIMKSVSVRPEVDTTVASPMAVDSNAKPVFTVNTIPGLWYAVKTSTTSGNDFAVELSTIYQAQYGQAATALPTASAPTTVKYYKIAVGASRAALLAQ